MQMLFSVGGSKMEWGEGRHLVDRLQIEKRKRKLKKEGGKEDIGHTGRDCD